MLVFYNRAHQMQSILIIYASITNPCDVSKTEVFQRCIKLHTLMLSIKNKLLYHLQITILLSPYICKLYEFFMKSKNKLDTWPYKFIMVVDFNMLKRKKCLVEKYIKDMNKVQVIFVNILLTQKYYAVKMQHVDMNYLPCPYRLSSFYSYYKWNKNKKCFLSSSNIEFFTRSFMNVWRAKRSRHTYAN